MVNFIIIAFSIIAGMVFRRAKLIPQDAHKGINVWVLYLALPAVSFKYIPKIQWSTEMLLPALSPLIVWAGSWLFMELYCRYKKYSQRSRSTLELASGYSNTSFIGFPLIVAYYSERELSTAIVCDQAMFILLSTVGIISAIKGNRTETGGIKAAVIAKRLFTFPPFLGCIVAIVLSFTTDLSVAEPFFDKLVVTVGPLALFSVGLQLKFNGWRQEIYQISMALLYKLIIAPALVLVVVLFIGMKGHVARISVFEAAMPTLVTGSLIAEQFRLNSRLINLIIGIGIILGFVTTAFWKAIMDLLVL
ncbi:hypothetical protein PBAL39_00757 [Pedobacter sp. BAL39]|uniref:AEC family transporter n=1 Tax=Pedobacter sp. BAL39 TaxID=391596 RepID=UPI0001559D98|nr:AEC family transporter [Pedobacter sp. BAL39]EDM38100.1 hypothetical protein PBAL39_00757 [Pedobacter sp. BAL39]